MDKSRAPRLKHFAAAALLGLLWIAANALLLRGGVRMGGDSHVYLAGSQDLAGALSHDVQASYLGTIATLAATRWIGLGAFVGANLLVSAIAAVALFDLTRRYATATAGFLAAGFYLLYPDLMRWNAYVLSDSLYISAVILSAWATDRLADGASRWLWLVPVVAATFRPTGWVLPVVAAAYVVSRTARPVWVRAAGVGTILAIAGAAVLFLPSTAARIEEGSPGDKFTQGVVIPSDRSTWLAMPEGDPPPAYLVAHPVAAVRLAATRVWTEIRQTRPFYARTHNLVIAGALIPTYLLALIGFLRARPRYRYLLLSMLLAHAGVIAIAFASYDGRFWGYVLPLIGSAAAIGLVDSAARLRRAKDSPI